MKTSELKQLVEEQGFLCSVDGDVVYINTNEVSEATIAVIDKRRKHSIDSLWEGNYPPDDLRQDELFQHIYEYVSTPVEEREEEQLYYVQLVNDVDGFLNRDIGHGNLLISNSPENCDFQTRFTEEEINEMNPKYMQFAIPVEDYKYS